MLTFMRSRIHDATLVKYDEMLVLRCLFCNGTGKAPKSVSTLSSFVSSGTYVSRKFSVSSYSDECCPLCNGTSSIALKNEEFIPCGVCEQTGWHGLNPNTKNFTLEPIVCSNCCGVGVRLVSGECALIDPPKSLPYTGKTTKLI